MQKSVCSLYLGGLQTTACKVNWSTALPCLFHINLMSVAFGGTSGTEEDEHPKVTKFKISVSLLIWWHPCLLVAVMNDLCRKSHNVSTKPRVLSSRSDRNATEEGQLVRFYVDNKTVVDAKLAISANHNKWIAILVAASQQSRGFSPFPCLLFSIKSIGETVVFVLAVNTASYICERCR